MTAQSPDVPYRTRPKAPAGHGHHHGHHEHLSGWPLFIGIVAAIPFIGLVSGSAVVAVIGFLLLAMGVVGWVREDYLQFPKGPNPLTMHTQGVKDNGWWGIILFLATEVVLFGSLFAVWFHSAAESLTGWPPSAVRELAHWHMPVVLPGIATGILILSGFVLMWGEKGLFAGDRRRFLTGLGGAILLGLVFLTIQAYEYYNFIQEGFVLGVHVFTGSFYGLTGTHGIHVLGGLIFLSVIFARAARGQFDAERHVAVTAAAYYWHFVDIVWILLYLVVYVGVGMDLYP
jgi:cytochrome c oxidase subunit III